MTGNEVKKLFSDIEEFIKTKPAKTKGVIDEETKKELDSSALSLASKIVEFEKSCIEIGLNDCKIHTAEEIADSLINKPHSFLIWLEKEKFDFIAEMRYKDSEKVVEKPAKNNDFEYDD